MLEVKDNGAQREFSSGMVRDTGSGKVQYGRVLDGPMFERWAAHLTRMSAAKYHDVAPGVPNWTLAKTPQELQEFKESALRHFVKWYRGDADEDHAAAVIFNINGKEYVEGKVLEPATSERGEVWRVDGNARSIEKVPAVEVLDDHGHSGFVPGEKMGAK